MKPPSTRLLKWYYTRINNVAFDGKLPKCIFRNPDFKVDEDRKKKDLAWSYTARSLSGTTIVINWEHHAHEFSWLLALIHEMVHVNLLCLKIINHNCRGNQFQKKVFWVMKKMGWGLL